MLPSDQTTSPLSTGLLDLITDGVCALDREWRFTYVNRPLAGLAGRTPDELIGKNAEE